MGVVVVVVALIRLMYWQVGIVDHHRILIRFLMQLNFRRSHRDPRRIIVIVIVVAGGLSVERVNITNKI